MKHQFNSENASKYGKKGGLKTKKRGKKYFAMIGSKGGLERMKKFSTGKDLQEKVSLL